MSILDSAEALYQAKNYSGTGAWLDEANSHDAQLGSSSGSDTNDPLFKDFDGFQYLSYPPNNGNFVADFSEPDSADVKVEEVATIAVWYRPTGNNTNTELFSTRGNEGILIKAGGSTALKPTIKLDATSGSDIDWDADSAVTIDEWHHLCLTVDHTTAVDEANLYIDGVGIAANPIDISTLGDINGYQLMLGSTGNNHPRCDYASVEMYKDIATSGEVSTVAAGPPGTLFDNVLTSPVTVVDFRDTSMMGEASTSFTDPQGNTYTITRDTTGLVMQVIDRAQFALTTDDYFEIPDDANLDFAGSEDLSTITVFRASTVAAGEDVLLAKKDDLTTSAGYALLRSTANGKGLIADGTADDDDTAATVAVLALHSVAMVRNTTDDDVETFLDGVGSGSATTDSTTATLANALPLRIGATSNTAASFFEGVIVAVALWRSALTDAQVLEAHQRLTQLPAFPPFQRRQNTLVRM